MQRDEHEDLTKGTFWVRRDRTVEEMNNKSSSNTFTDDIHR